MPSIVPAILDLFPDLKDPGVQNDIKKFLVALMCSFVSIYAIYKVANDPDGLTGQFYTYSLVIILPIVVGIFILNPVFQKQLTLSSLYYAFGVILVISVAIYMFYRILNPASVAIATYILMFLAGLAVIIGLAVVYRIFIRVIVNATGFKGFLLRILFLLPCLLLDSLEALFAELKNTPKMVVALFVLEILVILSYLYVLPFIKQPAKTDGINLLDKPVFLTKIATIGTGYKLSEVASNNLLSEYPLNQNVHYTISMWVYINPQSDKHEKQVFRYGELGATTGYPKITYDPSSDYLKVYVNPKSDSANQITIQPQVWNQLVVSYTEDSADIFLNGDLVKSVNKPALPDLKDSDIVETGYGDNSAANGGLYGAICNVNYYKRPLEAFEVAASYNLNRYRNPPTYNDST